MGSSAESKVSGDGRSDTQVESQAAAEESAAPPAASGEELVLPAESHTEHHQQEQQQEEQQAAEGHEGNTMSTASAAPASPDGPEEAAVTAPAAEEEELLSAAQLPPANPAPQSAPEAAAAVTGDEGQPQPEHAAEAEQQQHKPAQAVGEHHAPHHLSKPAGQQPAAPQRVEYKAASAGANRCSGVKGLTFSGPPYVPKAKPYKRADFSHSAVDLLKIAHDNQLLVQHLTTISKAVPSAKDVSPPSAPGNTSSSAINRRKQAAVIAQENHALYQRLVTIRPSKDISRDMLEAEHRRNEVYKVNCAQFKCSSAAHTASVAH